MRSTLSRVFVCAGVFLATASPLIAQKASERTLSRFLDRQQVRDQQALRSFKAAYGLQQTAQLGTTNEAIYLHAVRNGRPLYRTALGLKASEAVSADDVWAGTGIDTPISGDGITLGIWEYYGYARPTHDEFAASGGGSRINGPLGTNHNGLGTTSHATRITGMAAAGGSNGTLKGVAYEADIDAYDDSLDTSEMMTAAAAGLLVSNHSYGAINGWGPFLDPTGGGDCGSSGPNCLRTWHGDPSISSTEDYKFGFYDDDSRAWDLIANTYPNYNIVVAAGNDRITDPGNITHWVFTGAPTNDGWEMSSDIREKDCGVDGYDCMISGMQTAKNIISVGAVANIDGTGCSDNPVIAPPGVPLAMVSYSAWGPTDDGRIAPDFVAPGFKVPAPTAGSDTSSSCGGSGGTSNAAPVVTGILALLAEHQQNLFANTRPAATYKALLAQTATDLGNTGPDYQHGWGLPNTQLAAELMQDDKDMGGDYLIHEQSLADGDTFTIALVSDGTPLRATLAWNDPAGTPVAPALNPPDLMLVNDLDMRINGAEGTFFPWTLDPANPGNVATRASDNFRDNIEQVLIDTPTAGALYTLTLSHKGTLNGGSQAFSLVLSGLSELRATPLALKVLLHGPHTLVGAGTMGTALNTTGQLPVAHPYTGLPWSYTGGETVSAGFFSTHTDLVDWVLVELRTGTAAATAVDTVAALLRSDGRLMHLDGVTPLLVPVSGAHYVVVRHRSHLDLMTSTTIDLGNQGGGVYDLTTGQGQAFGVNPMLEMESGIFGMYGGDGNAENGVTAFDMLQVWLPQNGGPVGYWSGDYNMNSSVTAFDILQIWLLSNGNQSQVPG